jgi:flap endonuclease-1
LTNNKGEITSHILGLFNKSLSFLEKGIIPIYVFDGKPPQLKHKILDARKQVRKKALEKLSDAQTPADKIKYLKRSVLISRDQMNQCRELLNLMGIPYVDAPEEADSELSYLCKNSMVYAVLTEDMDILTFGSPRIIRNLTSSKKVPFEIELNEVLTKLDLSYEHFIELCILFGCDYCLGLSDIKVNLIYQIYIQNKTIEGTILQFKKMGYVVPDKIDYVDAKSYFMNSMHTPIDNQLIKLNKPDSDKLLDLLVNKYGLIKFKIVKKINRLEDLFKRLKDY